MNYITCLLTEQEKKINIFQFLLYFLGKPSFLVLRLLMGFGFLHRSILQLFLLYEWKFGFQTNSLVGPMLLISWILRLFSPAFNDGIYEGKVKSSSLS